jgi:hypothetical protein
LAKPLGQPSTDQTCENVGRAASGRRNDDAHGLYWIGLRPCNPRCGRDRGSARRAEIDDAEVLLLSPSANGHAAGRARSDAAALAGFSIRSAGSQLCSCDAR